MNVPHPSERTDPSLREGCNALQATRCHVYPVALVAGLALSAAGAGMQMAGNAKAKSAMDNAQTAELLRQRGHQQEADAAFQQNVARSDRATAEAEQAAGADRRIGETAAIDQTGAGVPAPITAQESGSATPNSAAAAAKRSAATTRAAGSAWSNLVGAAKARLAGGDDWQLEQGIANQRTNQDLAITSSKARGSAAILPYEMNEASHKGDSLRGWGQLVSALGAVTGGYAATAGSAAGAAGTTAGLYDIPNAWGNLGTIAATA